jgi:hypothetical protein
MSDTIIVAVISGLLVSVTTLLVQWRLFRRQYRMELSVEAAVRRLLQHRKWRLRTLKTIKHHIGGLDDDELRKTLLRAGAVRFEDKDGIEVWGLIERVQDLLEIEYGTRSN